MMLPLALALALSIGLGASLAGRVELCVSPRPMFLTGSFASLMFFTWLVLVPVSAYFYVFHGDWFLLYAVDVRRIPSALALIGFVTQGALAVLTFAIGATLVRSQRTTVVGWGAAVLAILGLVPVLVLWERVVQVGSYEEFHGDFGLEGFTAGSIWQGTLAMGGILLLTGGYLLYRLQASGRRR